MTNSHNSPERPSHQPDPDEHFRETGAVFHIGNPNESIDVLSEDHASGEKPRFLIWEMSPDDGKVGPIAGWQSIEPEKDMFAGVYNGYAHLKIPHGTRAARSVLGGLRAWEREKEEVLSYLDKYQQEVREKLDGKVDVSVSLDSIARTGEGHEFFVAPPHKLTDDPEQIQEWAKQFNDDLEAVLTGDETQNSLTTKFHSDVVKLYRKGK